MQTCHCSWSCALLSLLLVPLRKSPNHGVLFACAEPMLEAWPFSLEARGGSTGRALSLTSQEHVNLTLTPAAFRSIGDAKAFAETLMQPHALNPTPDRPSAAARLVARSVARWLAATRGRMATLYRWPGTIACTLASACSYFCLFVFVLYNTHGFGYVQHDDTHPKYATCLLPQRSPKQQPFIVLPAGW